MSTLLPAAMPRRREHRPPRTVDELRADDVSVDSCYRASTARVVFTDTAALQRDFPALRAAHILRSSPGMRNLSRADRAEAVRAVVDRWLLEHAGLVSGAQARANRVNEAVRTEGKAIRVHRPPRYGRAGIVSVRDRAATLPAPLRKLSAGTEGLVDLKGIGVPEGVVPRRGPDADGLLTLGKAFAEYSYRQLLSELFRRSQLNFSTLPIYGIVDLGFDRHPRTPVGVLARRAHRRHAGQVPALGTARHRVSAMVETFLRRHGITSVGLGCSTKITTSAREPRTLQDYPLAPARAFLNIVARGRRSLTIDVSNVQTTDCVDDATMTAELVDFGNYDVRRRFEHPLTIQVCNRPFYWGGMISPRDRSFVQPDARIAAREEDWGEAHPTESDVKELCVPRGVTLPAIELFGLRLALAFRRGHASGAEIKRQLDDHVARTASRW